MRILIESDAGDRYLDFLRVLMNGFVPMDAVVELPAGGRDGMLGKFKHILLASQAQHDDEAGPSPSEFTAVFFEDDRAEIDKLSELMVVKCGLKVVVVTSLSALIRIDRNFLVVHNAARGSLDPVVRTAQFAKGKVPA